MSALQITQNVLTANAALFTIFAPMQTIYEIRSRLGYSQSEFADLLGVRQGTISNYEQGLRRPSIGLAKKILALAQERGYRYTLDELYQDIA